MRCKSATLLYQELIRWEQKVPHLSMKTRSPPPLQGCRDKYRVSANCQSEQCCIFFQKTIVVKKSIMYSTSQFYHVSWG